MDALNQSFPEELPVDVEMLGNGTFVSERRIIHAWRTPDDKLQVFFKNFILTFQSSDIRKFIQQPGKTE